MALSAAPAFAGTEPTVVAKAEGALVEGQFRVILSCTAKSNQTTPTITVIEFCGTNTGASVPGSGTPGAAATTAGTSTAAFAPFSVCITAYSVNNFGVRSDTKSACAAAVAGTAAVLVS